MHKKLINFMQNWVVKRRKKKLSHLIVVKTIFANWQCNPTKGMRLRAKRLIQIQPLISYRISAQSAKFTYPVLKIRSPLFLCSSITSWYRLRKIITLNLAVIGMHNAAFYCYFIAWLRNRLHIIYYILYLTHTVDGWYSEWWNG